MKDICYHCNSKNTVIEKEATRIEKTIFYGQETKTLNTTSQMRCNTCGKTYVSCEYSIIDTRKAD